MATPRFTDPATKIPGINPPSATNMLASEKIPSAGDFVKPRHFVVLRGTSDHAESRAPAVSRRQHMLMSKGGD